MRKWTYIATLTASLASGTLLGWTALGARVNNSAYDVWTRLISAEPHAGESVVVAIDEETLRAKGGMRNIRGILADALDAMQPAQPKTVAIDVILSDATDEATDARLERSLEQTRNLILPADITATGWETPLPRFAKHAKALGHVHPEIDRLDGVSRAISLEEIASGARHWALSLEAFRAARGLEIMEAPDEIEVGPITVPAMRSNPSNAIAGRPMQIRYISNGIPTVSALHLAENVPNTLRGKAVFLGVTALSAARDRLLNPYGQNVPGVEVHAHAYETLAGGDFLKPVGEMSAFALAALFAAAAGAIFHFFSGRRAYVAAIALLIIANLAPLFFFQKGYILPFFGTSSVAWLACACAATLHYFSMRQKMTHTESEKVRYQQAMQWAAHEMRTPLTAIQGSSEIMTRYALPAKKSKELSEMINSESKRLGRLIQTFLDVERLADGHMELKQHVFAAAELVKTCLDRVETLADRKHIHLVNGSALHGEIKGDRELMEYALYNLLTNAIKYSPEETTVTVSGDEYHGELRVSVQDQGMGMDAKELKSIFSKFYRTKKAEQSGEVGTGIGLSLVEQIVTRHGGRIEVTSQPEKGSCFTMILRAFVGDTSDRETAHRRG